MDERLEKYLNEKDEIAKVVIEHGISNEQTCVDDVVSASSNTDVLVMNH